MNLILDEFDSYGYEDFSLHDVSGGEAQVQGISKTQICKNHRWSKTSLLEKVTIPQNHTKTDYTANTPLYLVIYGDATGGDNFEFVAHSDNTQIQKAGGADLVFVFSTKPDLSRYHKYRLFYTTDISTTPLEPTTASEYSNTPKMAFNSLVTDKDCAVWQSNGVAVYYRAINATFTTYTVINEDLAPHKDNMDIHLTHEQKQGLLALLARKDELLALL